jgi:hypothetical protein
MRLSEKLDWKGLTKIEKNLDILTKLKLNTATVRDQ